MVDQAASAGRGRRGRIKWRSAALDPCVSNVRSVDICAPALNSSPCVTNFSPVSVHAGGAARSAPLPAEGGPRVPSGPCVAVGDTSGRFRFAAGTERRSSHEVIVRICALPKADGDLATRLHLCGDPPGLKQFPEG